MIITRAAGAADFEIGEVVHVTADRAVARAKADVAANLDGAIGLAVGWTVVFGGVHQVRLEAGLAPVAKQTLYVSPTQAGRATNIQPALPGLTRGFATILDTSRYAQDGTVDCVMSDAPGGVVPSGAEGFLSETVINGGPQPIALGEVLRMSGNDTVTKAQADALPNVQGTIGVALQAAAFPGTVPVATEGKAVALLEAGLLGVAFGQTLWVSPTTPGRATNIKPLSPLFALCIGIVKDATGVTSPTGPNDTAIADIDVDCEPSLSAAPGPGAGLSAYGHAVGQSDNVIGADALVGYDLGATVFPNAGFTSVPAPGGGTSFVVATSGAYEYDFYIAGLPASNVPLEFVLQIGAVMQGPAHEFRSETTATATDVLVCRGQGIIQLTAGDSVAVRNRTNTVTDTVTQASVPLGGEAGANRTFTLKKLN